MGILVKWNLPGSSLFFVVRPQTMKSWWGPQKLPLLRGWFDFSGGAQGRRNVWVYSVSSEGLVGNCWFMLPFTSQKFAYDVIFWEVNEVKLPASQYSWVSRPASSEACLATVAILPPLRQMEDAEVSCLLSILKHQASEDVLPAWRTEAPG